MNKSLIYLRQKTVINFIKNLLKKPLKAIGIVLVVLYYFYLPFMMKNMFIGLGLNTKEGFVLIASIATLYLSLPMTLAYFKRKGVDFRKQDVNFILASPTSPKQALLYALSKDVLIILVLQVMFLIAAVFVFDISILTSLIYISVNVVFSNILSYSLAVIMYASEDITLKQKQLIKRIAYIILFSFTVFFIIVVVSQTLKNGFDIAYLISTISSPIVLMIPIFGWQLGWLNLILLGVTPITLFATTLFFVSTIYLAYYAYKMVSTGDYYEDALSFSEHVAYIEGKKGDISMSEAFGSKQKKHAYKGEIKGNKAQVIFYKQLIERRRVRKYFLGFGDLVYLIAGIGLGVLYFVFDDFINPDYFFEIMLGISIYLSVFFKPAATWKSEFKNYYIFVMPDTFKNKLFYATLFEHMLSMIQIGLLTLSAGILMQASFLSILYAIIASVLIKFMITYISIFFEEVIGAKIGKTVGSIISVFVSIIIMIIPVLSLVFVTSISLFLGFLSIVIYSLVIGFIFLYLAATNLGNIESLDA